MDNHNTGKKYNFASTEAWTGLNLLCSSKMVSYPLTFAKRLWCTMNHSDNQEGIKSHQCSTTIWPKQAQYVILNYQVIFVCVTWQRTVVMSPLTISVCVQQQSQITESTYIHQTALVQITTDFTFMLQTHQMVRASRENHMILSNPLIFTKGLRIENCFLAHSLMLTTKKARKGVCYSHRYKNMQVGIYNPTKWIPFLLYLWCFKKEIMYKQQETVVPLCKKQPQF